MPMPGDVMNEGAGDLEGRSQDSAWTIFLVFLRLGLTSFGGPVAHLGFFRTEFVDRRRWLREEHYADIVALSQFLPGPASSKVGIIVGVLRGGIPGALAAWLGFTLPSALAMIAFGYGVTALGDLSAAGWLHGLKIVAVAVVAQAVWSMARNLCPDRERLAIAAAATVVVLAVPTSLGQIAAIVLGGLIGWRFLPGETIALIPLPLRISRMWSLGAVVLFGGGHVVLPLLQAATVPPGWVSNDTFLAGYGAAQAVPGPLFTFAAYLGAVMNGWAGATLALVAIFLPAFLLVVGALPFWDVLRTRGSFQAALRGINAAVVGLLLSALYHPVWTSAIHSPADFALALAAFSLLAFWRTPPWLVVAFAAAGGSAIAAFR